MNNKQVILMVGIDWLIKVRFGMFTSDYVFDIGWEGSDSSRPQLLQNLGLM